MTAFRVEATDGDARVGVLSLPHGEVETPAFMAVGTRGAVRAVDVHDLRAAGASIVLANTYHLMLRPGPQEIARRGGLHTFMGWSGPLLTDSGGYQILSLGPQVREDGAMFRSIYDGSAVRLTPEQAVEVQEEIGADIAMALDVCIGLPAPEQAVKEGMLRTLRWAERSLAVHRRSDQALFGIVQGGVDLDLRAASASATAALGFPGFGIGGLSVGESPTERDTALAASVAELPTGKPRYLMGVGDTEGVLEAVGRGIDLFDCVRPTRLARHGRVLAATGDFNLRKAEYGSDDRPLDPECRCLACRTHSRSYIRHLFTIGEVSALRLVTIHNLTYTLDLMEAVRAAIRERRLTAFKAAVKSRRVSVPGPSG